MRNNEEIILLIKSYLDNSSMSMSELAAKAGGFKIDFIKISFWQSGVPAE